MNIFSAKKKEIVWFMCKFNYKCSIYKNGVDLKQVVHLIKKLSIGIVKKKKKKSFFFYLLTAAITFTSHFKKVYPFLILQVNALILSCW